MLRSLSIQNYALINHIEIDFNEGFSIITGETGAGKSILLGALSLVLGQRPDANVLKNKERKCVIEGVFSVLRYNLKSFFEEHNLDYEKEVLLRREIHPDGRTRAFINDTPVNLRVLKDLGAQLVDIHSQNQNLTLGDAGFQLRIVDTFAGHKELLNSYQKNYHRYCELKKALQALETETERIRADMDYYQFQFNQLNEATLEELVQEEMEQELKTLNHAEEIKSNLFKASGILSAEDTSVIAQLKEAEESLRQLRAFYPEVDELHRRLESASIELQDLASELEHKNEHVEFDPERIEFLTQRLDTIYSLQQKHRVSTVKELLKVKEELEQKIQKISFADEEIDSLKTQVIQQKDVLEDLAQQLRLSRAEVFPKMESTIINHLQNLGIPHVSFKINQHELDDFCSTGKDQVLFLFSANKNGILQEIPQVASGGELSRLMLSIKYLISASTALPSIVFDEIDIGVSGEVADKMGTMLHKMAENIQVISITHLPQIAAKGTYHYKVYKADDELETYSNIVLLNREQRIEELAKMLSGSDLTQAAFENAKILLNS